VSWVKDCLQQSKTKKRIDFWTCSNGFVWCRKLEHWNTGIFDLGYFNGIAIQIPDMLKWIWFSIQMAISFEIHQCWKQEELTSGIQIA
jgi:hypothetical protein